MDGWIVDGRFVEAFEALTLALKQSLPHARSDHNWTTEWRCHRYALLRLYPNPLHGNSEPMDQAWLFSTTVYGSSVQVGSAKLVTYMQVLKLSPTAGKSATSYTVMLFGLLINHLPASAQWTSWCQAWWVVLCNWMMLWYPLTLTLHLGLVWSSCLGLSDY